MPGEAGYTRGDARREVGTEETVRIGRIRYEQGERVPRGYGLAWHDLFHNQVVVFPIPFNLVARWLRELYFWLRNPWTDAMTRDQRAAYLRGYHDGARR